MPTPTPVLVLAYKNCDTCRKALRWLDEHDVAHTVRPIVDDPPTAAELKQWIPASGVGIRKWLNTRGQSYRALGRERITAARDEEIRAWLAADGKLVKRPVLVMGATVLVGFDPQVYGAQLSKART